MAKKRRRRPWNAIDGFETAPSDDAAKAAAAPHRLRRSVPTEVTSDSKWVLDFGNENVIHSLSAVTSKPPGHSVRERPTKLTLPLAPRLVATPAPNASSPPNESTRRITIHPVSQKKAAAANCDTGAMDVILSFEDKESLKGADNEIGALVTQNHSTGVNPGPERDATGRTENSAGETLRVNSSLVASRGLSESDAESVLPSSTVMSQEQDACVEDRESLAHHGGKALSTKPCSSNVAIPGRTGPLSTIAQPSRILVPDSCHIQMEDSPFGIPRETLEQAWVPKSATIQVLVPDTPDQAMQLSNSEVGDTKGPLSTTTAQVEREIQKSPVARNLLQAMELTDSDPRPVESDSDSLFRDEKSGAATTDVHAEVAGTRNDERMSEEGEGSFSGAQDSNCSGDRSVIVATSSSRTLSEQPSSCGTGQHETGQDESESGERMPCIAEGKLKRILTQVGLSPGSIGPNQSLALDPIATKDAWDLLNRYGGFDSSSASLRQNQSVTGDGGRIEESNEDDEMTASSPSEVCPTTPHKKPAVSRLSLDQNAGSSYSSLGSNGTPGGSNVRRFDVCGESQDIFNSSLAAFRANDRQAEGDNITTPKALIATRQGIGVNGSSTKGSNTGRSSVRGKENREVQPPRRLQLTPVPLDLTDEPDDEATKRQIPVPSKARPGEGTSPKNLDVEMTKPEAPIGNIPDSRLGDVGANENIGTAKHSQQGNDDISLKRGLFLSERKGMPTLDNFMDNNPAVMVSGFTTAKGTALAVSKKKLHEICLENLNLDENSQELEAKTFAEERESRYISRSGLPAKKNARPDEHDPSAAVGKPAKRPRESLESMVLNDNGPDTPFLQRRQPGFVSMFTTGKGAPVPVPNSSRLNEARRVLDGDGKKMSMFSTGKGVPLPEPSLMQLDQARRRLEKGEMRPPLQSSGHKLKRRESLESFAFQEPPPEFKTPRLERNQPAFSSMFQTGKGVPLPAPTLRQLDQAKQRLGGGEMKTPLFSDLRSTVLKNNPAAHSGTGQMSLFSNDTPFQPLFQNGRRRSVNILQANQPLARVLPFHLATSPREPPVPKMGGRAQHDPVDLKISAPDSSKRVSFRALPRSTSKPSGTLLTGTSSNRHLLFRTPPAKANGFPKATNARVRASAMKGTPFKRPRRVAPVTPRQPTNSKGNTLRQTKSLSLIFPKGLVPRLSSFGRLIPPSGENATGSNAEGRDLEGEGNHSNRQTMSSPVFVADPAQGLSVVLFKESFGDWHIFPKELKDFVKFESISTFSVENCMSLLSHVFPAAEQKAATRIGSRAWTRMSYALSVWKLYRLENGADRSEHSRPVFLTAANIIRDLWRRIDREWHNNQAPHLTQMLRRDASPRSHIVLIVSNISERGTGNVVIEVSDGWYICRLKPCNVLLSRIQAGFLKVGDKIHVSDSDLISVSNLEQFFFGDGDELGTSILAPKANCVKRVRRELTSKCMLGIRKTPLFTRTMRGLQPAGGMCPGAQVAILRSYPVFYIESNSRDSEKHSIFRRQEAEEAAQAVFENDLRESRMVAGNGNEQEFQQRAVSSAVDISVTGILDNALDSAAERSVRIYRPNEEVLRLLSKEGSVVQLPAMKPNGKLWVALSLAVRPVAVSDYSRIPAKPRCASTCADLISTTIPAGTDFDGVYTVLHLAESGADSTQRFAFLLDNLDKLTPIALELKGVDAETVPRAISRARKPDQYPIVVLRDATKTGIDDERGIIHATVTLRTEILSAAGLKRRKGPSWTYLQERLRKVEKDQEDEAKSKAKLEVNREAVMSFTSGRRRSISAYFSSTQDSQPQA